MKKMLLDGDELHFNTKDLPLLIHGRDGDGSSLFSIHILADLYSQGSKILFTSRHHMAREEFRKQVGPTSNTILIESEVDIANAHTQQVIFVPFEKSDIFKRLLTELPDSTERIIYFKNFDLFDTDILETVCKQKSCIVQGDLNKVSDLTIYQGVGWSTELYFSQPPEQFDSRIPKTPQYCGFLRQDTHSGIVSLA